MASVEPEKPDTRAPEEAAVPVVNHRIREIAGIVLVASSALAFISLISDGVGAIGAYLSYGLRWMAGQASYLVPAMVFLAGLLVFRGRWQGPVIRRCVGVLLLFAVVLVTLHLVHIWPHFPHAWNVLEHARLGMRGQGGGAAGGVLAAALMQAFGLPGVMVLSVALVLIAAVLTFDVSLSRLVVGLLRGVVGFAGRCLRWGGRTFWYWAEEGWHRVRRMRERRQLQQLQRSGLIPERTGSRGAKAAEGLQGSQEQAYQVTAHHDLDWRSPEEPAPGGVNALRTPEERPSGAGAPPGSMPQSMPHRRLESEVAVTRWPVPSAAGHRVDGDPAESRQDGSGNGASERRSAVLTLKDLEAQSRLRTPPTSLLELPRPSRRPGRLAPVEPDLSARLEETLASFGVEAKVVNVSRGPVITRYEVQPRPGIKVSRIVSLADDIALALAAAGVRIEAPVPGKPVVGIEVPNKQVSPVYLREVLESDSFVQSTSPLTIGLGKDIAGQPVVADLKKLLHLLIAGATGSGKSVCLNAIIISLLYKARPAEVKFIMIDPKRVELAVYDGIPHLIAPVVTDPRKAAGVLRWVVKEMERRYQLCSEVGVRNVDGYNALIRRQGQPDSEILPYLVVIIDELADLMLVAAADVEDSICRLAQMARAAGIYLIIATQRPSVDVITGLIKANVPSRIAFAVSSQVDSRTILDMAGAERLLGKGDMLFHPIGSGKPQRVQGAFIEDREVEDVVAYWKSQQEPQYQEEVLQEQEASTVDNGEVDDELFEDAVRLVMEQGHASVSMIQRRFRVGYSRAARLIDMMEMRGIVGPYQGSKPREVLRSYPRGDE